MLNLYLWFWVCLVSHYRVLSIPFLLYRLIYHFYRLYIFVKTCFKAFAVFYWLACLLTRSCDVLNLAKKLPFEFGPRTFSCLIRSSYQNFNQILKIINKISLQTSYLLSYFPFFSTLNSLYYSLTYFTSLKSI
jgi:hypothetical protein